MSIHTEEGAAMLASRSMLENLIASCPDGIIGVNRQGTIIIFNRAAEIITGRLAEEVLGKASITDVYDPPELAHRIKKDLYGPGYGGEGRLEGYEVSVRGAEGKQVPIRLSAILLFEEGREVGSVGFFHDLTARKRIEDELRRRSITDSLTGLFNRRHFHTVLTEEMGRAVRYQRALSIALIDLDHFKPFNDTYGHAEGDNILRLLSEVATGALRGEDKAFRMGGDEFALIMPETDIAAAHLALERLRNSFNNAWPAKMAYLGKKLNQVTMSIGLAQMAEGEKSDRLVMRADLAMYEAKKDGGNSAIMARERIKAD